MIPEKPPHQHGWRDVLAWGCVVVFLGAPPIILTCEALGVFANIEKSGYLKEWYFSVTGVLVSLAGLKTWQQNVHAKHNGGNNRNE
jgi:hypothetical protein